MNSDEILRRGLIGRWQVVRLIGEGGWSWVFEVEDKNSGKRLALKALRPEAAEGEQYRRFWREAKLLAAQNDPNLVQIILLDRDEELQLDFYVMELLTGRNLAQLIKAEGALPTRRALEIFLGTLQGLSRLHTLPKPIIHRDIKPPNIFITGDGRAKLLDLGIAGTQRNRGDETVAGGEDTFTTTAMYKGTVKYSSPEQLQILELDTSSDVFSMGLCLFEALEGRHPYLDAADLPTVTYQAVLGFYARLEGSRSEIKLKFQKTPKPIQPVIRKAVSLRPRDRYRDASEMRDALMRADEGKSPQTGYAQPPRAQESRPPSASRWPIAAIAAVLLVAAAVGIWWVIPPEPTPERVVNEREKLPSDEQQEERIPPVRPRPTAEQESTRAEVTRVVAEVERLSAEGSLGGEVAGPVLESRRAGDAHWMQERYAEADRAYRAAISTGIQVIATARERLDSRAIAAHRQAAEQARELAKQAGAEVSASSDWSGAEDLLKQAQRAEAERRSADAAGQYASAKGAYDSAAAVAGKALADAKAAEKAAQASRAQVAKREEIVVPPNRPPTLALEPAGTLNLEIGESTTIQADARDPENQAVEITYAIEVPGAGRKTARGSTLRFEPDREGDFLIVARATDSEGAVSPPVRIFARVRAKEIASAVAVPPPDQLKATLDEYARAIESKDIDALKGVMKLDRKSEDFWIKLFSSDYALAMSVTPLKENIRGKEATLRFSQSLHAVDSQGKHLPLNEGVFDAQLLRRSDGWQMQIPQRVK